MEEIIDAVMFEVENSGVVDKLSAGIVLTGGGALLRHLPQLVKFKTGLDVRIGYPVEQLATESIVEVNQPRYGFNMALFYQLKVRSILFGIFLFLQIFQCGLFTTDDPEDPEGKTRTGAGGIFQDIKERINSIFEENDSEM